MAKIIFKWRYLKANAEGKHSENLVKYIATRDGVEKLDDSWKSLPATKAQEKLIGQILSDYPDMKDSFEYQDYEKSKTKGAASEFISRAIEEKVDLIGKRENYVDYIAMRPHVEKTGAHGLFTDSDVPINLSAVAKEVAEHKGVVFTKILSLRREDAARLGYDKGSAWRNLLRSHTKEMAESMKIPLPDLRWYAAFHNESHHPHVHIVAYSAGKEPYMTEQGLHRLKSSFAREIFKQDLLQIYDRQTEHRNALAQESRDVLSEIVEQINTGGYDNETVELMLKELSDTLSRTKGKKVYGYLPPRAKNLVNGIVDELAKDSRIAGLYDLWYEQREEIIRTYTDTMPERIPLSQNKEFKSVRNAVIQETMHLLSNNVTFEESPEENDDPAPEISDTETEPSPKLILGRKKNSQSDTAWTYFFKAKDCLERDSEQYDPAEAVRLLTLAAVQGLDIAAYRLGKLFLRGEDIEKDVGTALHWLWQAAEQENPYAQYQLGKTYLKGEDVYADFSGAEELFEKASRQGNSYAKYSLAKMHLDGLAEHPDTGKALFLLRESAGSGNMWAAYLFGKILMRGELTEKDTAEAEKLLTSAAEKGMGSPQSHQTLWGEEEQRSERAFAACGETSDAQLVTTKAMYLLGRLYLSGDGIPKYVPQALYWLWQSAEQENQYAQYQLGKMYLYGQEVAQDYNMAVQLLTASADQGNPYARYVLEHYQPGTGRAPVGLTALRLIARLSQIIRDDLRREENGRQHIEKKLRQKIAEKMELHGQHMG